MIRKENSLPKFHCSLLLFCSLSNEGIGCVTAAHWQNAKKNIRKNDYASSKNGS